MQGMHLKLRYWWRRVVKAGQLANAFVPYLRAVYYCMLNRVDDCQGTPRELNGTDKDDLDVPLAAALVAS